jgi:hypothetical protein
LGADIAQINWQTSTDGIEFMDSALNTLIVALKAIRDHADSLRSQKDPAIGPIKVACVELRRLRAHRAIYSSRAAEVAVRCPKCGGTTFDPV